MRNVTGMSHEYFQIWCLPVTGPHPARRICSFDFWVAYSIISRTPKGKLISIWFLFTVQVIQLMAPPGVSGVWYIFYRCKFSQLSFLRGVITSGHMSTCFDLLQPWYGLTTGWHPSCSQLQKHVRTTACRVTWGTHSSHDACIRQFSPSCVFQCRRLKMGRNLR